MNENSCEDNSDVMGIMGMVKLQIALAVPEPVGEVEEAYPEEGEDEEEGEEETECQEDDTPPALAREVGIHAVTVACPEGLACRENPAILGKSSAAKIVVGWPRPRKSHRTVEGGVMHPSAAVGVGITDK